MLFLGTSAGNIIYNSQEEIFPLEHYPLSLDKCRWHNLAKGIDVIWKSVKQNPKKKKSFLWYVIYKLVNAHWIVNIGNISWETCKSDKQTSAIIGFAFFFFKYFLYFKLRVH